MARTTGETRIVDTNGNYEKSDMLKGYVATNKDEDITGGGISYYGFVDTQGNWYIQKITTTGIQFCLGTTNYATNWTNRATQSYANFDTIF